MNYPFKYVNFLNTDYLFFLYVKLSEYTQLVFASLYVIGTHMKNMLQKIY